MITDKIYDFILGEKMLVSGDGVVCGLSGGADSICLLLAMCELQEKLGITVEALHVNHCLRGKESDRDEVFCSELCKRLNVPFKAVSCDVKGFATENSLSTEEAARKLRYRIFADNSVEKKLATAHNADDNLETVILNLTRGSALKGISGIPAKRDNIIRPLLTVSRCEIEAFLAEKDQDFVTDSTNLSNDYTRNKIRHNIIPLMKEINPSVVSTSVRSISALREENQFIEAEADNAENKCRKGNTITGLDALPPVVRKRCLARLLSDNAIPYSAERLLAAEKIVVKSGKLNLSGCIYLISDGHTTCIKKIEQTQTTETVLTDLKIGENCIFAEKSLYCQLVDCDGLKKFETVNNLLTYYVLDYDKIIGRAFVRNRKFGDRIRLSGRDFTSSVKKLINEKIPADQRPFLHFIEDENGTVFAEKLGIADRVRPDGSSVNFLIITIRDSI